MSLTATDKATIKRNLGVKDLTDAMRAEIKDYAEARNEGFLSDEDFKVAVTVIITTGWDGADLLTKDYFSYRLQGHSEQEAAYLAVEANKELAFLR